MAWAHVVSTYPQKACGAAAENAVGFVDGGLSPGGRARSAGGRRGGRAFDVVVESLDDVARAGLFEIRRLHAGDGVFHLELGTR